MFEVLVEALECTNKAVSICIKFLKLGATHSSCRDITIYNIFMYLRQVFVYIVLWGVAGVTILVTINIFILSSFSFKFMHYICVSPLPTSCYHGWELPNTLLLVGGMLTNVLSVMSNVYIIRCIIRQSFKLNRTTTTNERPWLPYKYKMMAWHGQ